VIGQKVSDSRATSDSKRDARQEWSQASFQGGLGGGGRPTSCACHNGFLEKNLAFRLARLSSILMCGQNVGNGLESNRENIWCVHARRSNDKRAGRLTGLSIRRSSSRALRFLVSAKSVREHASGEQDPCHRFLFALGRCRGERKQHVQESRHCLTVNDERKMDTLADLGLQTRRSDSFSAYFQPASKQVLKSTREIIDTLPAYE
jgi:hypothetical protein